MYVKKSAIIKEPQEVKSDPLPLIPVKAMLNPFKRG